LGRNGLEVVDVEQWDFYHDQKDYDDDLLDGVLGEDLADLALLRLQGQWGATLELQC
jgi:hypothetical protein